MKKTLIKYSPMTVKEPVFISEIGFFIGFTHDEFVKHVQKRDKEVIFDKDTILDDDASYGAFHELDTTDEAKKFRAIQIEAFDTIIMKFNDDDIQNLGTLMHECIHAAQCVLYNRGVSVEWSEAEPLAYLAEFYFQCALKYIRDEQIKLDAKLKKEYVAKKKKKKAAAAKKKRTRYTHDDDE